MLEPFRIAIPDPVIEDLRRRLNDARLPPDDHERDWTDGTSPAYLRELVEYWRTGIDWRAQEALLNRFHQLRGPVDGTTIHLIHEKGRGPRPMPIILTHGFPDSAFRFQKLIPLLIDPAGNDAAAEDSFDVVAPSLPGYAFSEQRSASGGVFGFGDLWQKLMTDELGYARFGAHGGDWGSTVTEHIARSHAGSVIGIHLTDVPFWHAFQKPEDLTAVERGYLAHIEDFQKGEGAYAMIQGTRPQTLAPGLNDSPAGLAAWIVEKFKAWSDCGDAVETRFSKDELLANIMLYWTSQSIGSSFQPYRDFMKAGALRWTMEAAKGWLGSSRTPAGFALFPKDLSNPPREWAERFFNVQRWTEMPSGGHFAAMEEPELLAKDIRAFFRPLR
jgi:pimeloyl-ACP methyl ester carboxylesterase